nr:hypothetical protein 15 [bacterium]
MANFDVGIILRAYDRATKIFDKIERSFKVVEKSASNVNKKFQAVTHEANMLNMKLGLMAAGGAWAFNNQFVSVASKFEKYQTVLEQLEGSNAKAKKSMDWVFEFATKTPYELDNVFESFVKLRAYGLEPMNGLLRTLGDTSAAMDKPILMAVEAIADAVTGENERLKEFGIKARAIGDKIVYEYSQNGQTLTREASKSNRAMIQSTLEAIFNQKYAGAMNKLSRTWEGMRSNLADNWTKYRKLVMDAGVFDWLETRLKRILGNIDLMTNNGELEASAKRTADKIISVLESLERAFKQITPVVMNILRVIDNSIEQIGGYGSALKILAAIMVSKLVWSVLSLTKSLGILVISFFRTATAQKIFEAAQLSWYALGYKIEALMPLISARLNILGFNFRLTAAWIKLTTMELWAMATRGLASATAAMWSFTASVLANPITWWAVGIAGAAYLIYKNWEPISKFFTNFWDKLTQGFSKAFDMFKKFAAFSPLGILAGAGSIFAKSEGKMPSFDVGSRYISQTGVALVHEGEEIAPAGTINNLSGKGGGSISISYSPVIHLSGSGSQAKEEFSQILRKHKDEIVKMVENAQRNQRRLAF